MRNLSTKMIGLLLGTAMLIPSVAQAQDRGRDRGERRGGERSFNWQRGGGQAMRENAAGEAMARGRDAARAIERPAPVAQPQPAPTADGGRRWGGGDRVRGDGDGGQRGWNRDGDDNRQRDWGRRDANRGDATPGTTAGQRDWNRGDNDGRARNEDDRRRRDAARDRRNDGNERWSTDRRNWDRTVDRDGRNWDRNWTNDRDRWNNRTDGRWDRNWRNDRRYSWQDYRNRNRQIYRLPRYQPPRWGHSYRRWSPGFRWDSWYYSSSYWIADPWYYRLPPAYGDYRWVRYYNDAVLVDIRTGEIIDIIYTFFF